MNKLKQKDIIKKIFIDNYLIIGIVIASIIFHIMALINLGPNYSLNSDDSSYIESGITFLEKGQITMHGEISAQIMPGMTFFIALFALIFGKGKMLMLALKLSWLIMGVLTIVVVYKTLRLYTNKIISAIPCIFFLGADYIWMDNLILTETPFILLSALLIYHTLKLSINVNNKDYIMIIIYYIMAVFIRPNIGIYPIFLLIFLLLKKYDFKLLFKQCLIAGIILILSLTPWIYRNYKLFDKFIPLTYGVGNPLLLGTYQGKGYPSDEELNYKENVDEKMPDKMKYYLNNGEVKPYLTKYYTLEYDEMKAKYRMREWWKNNTKSMIISYAIYKPYILISDVFYWNEILNIPEKIVIIFRKIELILTLLAIVVVIIDKEKINEFLLLFMAYMFQIGLYSYTFAFDRYGITLIFMRYIVVGIGIDIIYKKIIKRRKNESINNNSSI